MTEPFRRIIAWEGEEKIPGQFVEVDAFKWDGPYIPVTFNYSHDMIVGRASDLKREEDGSITALIELSDDTVSIHEDLLTMPTTVFSNELVGDFKGEPIIVRSARIRLVTFLPPVTLVTGNHRGVPW